MSHLHENAASARMVCSLPLRLPAIVIARHLQLCPPHSSLHAAPSPPLRLCTVVQLLSHLLREECLSTCSLRHLSGACHTALWILSFTCMYIYMCLFNQIGSSLRAGTCHVYLCVPCIEESFNKYFQIGGTKGSKSIYFSWVLKDSLSTQERCINEDARDHS